MGHCPADPLTQIPLQQTLPELKQFGPFWLSSFWSPQTPSVQVVRRHVDVGHPLPHALQLSGSVCVLTQSPLQQVRPAPQLALFPHLQTPPEQRSPVGQVLPHPLQLFGSFCVSTHSPLQQVKPVPQLVPVFPHSHTPPEQCSPVGQVIGVPAQVPLPSQTSF